MTWVFTLIGFVFVLYKLRQAWVLLDRLEAEEERKRRHEMINGMVQEYRMKKFKGEL